MYYWIIFKSNKNQNTKMYLYKSSEINVFPGYTVLVKSKNKSKIGLVQAVTYDIPEEIDFDDSNIAVVENINNEQLNVQLAKNFVIAVIDQYSRLEISADYFKNIMETFLKENTYESDEYFDKAVLDMHELFSVTYKSTDKDLEYWKTLKEIRFYLRNGFVDEGLRFKNRVKHDPFEDTDDYLRIERELTKKLDQVMDDEKKRLKRKMGEDLIVSTVHLYWNHKKRILKDDYGVYWKSPVDLNPGVNFD